MNGEGNRQAAIHDLDRRRQVLPQKCGTQNRMSIQHPLPGSAKVLGIDRAGDRNTELFEIETTASPVVEAVEQQPLLQWRQRADVLDVVHAHASPSRALSLRAIRSRSFCESFARSKSE